jgi:hypothetical protein
MLALASLLLAYPAHHPPGLSTLRGSPPSGDSDRLPGMTSALRGYLPSGEPHRPPRIPTTPLPPILTTYLLRRMMLYSLREPRRGLPAQTTRRLPPHTLSVRDMNNARQAFQTAALTITHEPNEQQPMTGHDRETAAARCALLASISGDEARTEVVHIDDIAAWALADNSKTGDFHVIGRRYGQLDGALHAGSITVIEAVYQTFRLALALPDDEGDRALRELHAMIGEAFTNNSLTVHTCVMFRCILRQACSSPGGYFPINLQRGRTHGWQVPPHVDRQMATILTACAHILNCLGQPTVITEQGEVSTVLKPDPFLWAFYTIPVMPDDVWLNTFPEWFNDATAKMAEKHYAPGYVENNAREVRLQPSDRTYYLAHIGFPGVWPRRYRELMKVFPNQTPLPSPAIPLPAPNQASDHTLPPTQEHHPFYFQRREGPAFATTFGAIPTAEEIESGALAAHHGIRGHTHGIQNAKYRQYERGPITRTPAALATAGSVGEQLQTLAKFGHQVRMNEDPHFRSLYARAMFPDMPLNEIKLDGDWDWLYAFKDEASHCAKCQASCLARRNVFYFNSHICGPVNQETTVAINGVLWHKVCLPPSSEVKHEPLALKSTVTTAADGDASRWVSHTPFSLPPPTLAQRSYLRQSTYPHLPPPTHSLLQGTPQA